MNFRQVFILRTESNWLKSFQLKSKNKESLKSDLGIRKQFEPYELPFCDAEKINKKSIWQDETCELVINIQNLQFKGFNFSNDKENFFEIHANNINFDTVPQMCVYWHDSYTNEVLKM